MRYPVQDWPGTEGRWDLDGIFSCTRSDAGEYTYLPYNAWISPKQLGDYGYFSDSGEFGRRGSIFDDIEPRVSKADIIPRPQEVTAGPNSSVVVVDDCGLSLPSNPAFNSSLASLSSRLTNAYLVTRVVQCRREACAHVLCLLSDG